MVSDLIRTIIAVVITIAILWVGFSTISPIQPNPMVIKIIRGDLPPCESTIGTPTGYYCQVNNVSMFCKVDTHAADPFVRTHPYCEEMVYV